MSQVRIRARRPGDVPALVEALFEQQPRTRYPFRDPLPIPAKEFLHTEDALAAFTAEVDGRPVGHACRVAASASPAMMYAAAGWREAGRVRPDWLAGSDATGEVFVSVMVLLPDPGPVAKSG